MTTDATGAERPAERAANGACERLAAKVFRLIQGETAALPLGHLQHRRAQIDAGALHDAPEGGVGGGPAHQLLNQLFDHHADREPGGDLEGGFFRGGGRGADAGGGGGDRLNHLDREDYERPDDHVFGVLDIGRAIVDLVRQFPGTFDQLRQQALLTADLFPECVECVVGLAG
uniref:hypothetical protein n=1 Tax=Nocardia pseudovaccinii TaxID=189540 RepID=UPI0007A51B37|nr:hypothetical protein [Nocardia pseudovaccinii]